MSYDEEQQAIVEYIHQQLPVAYSKGVYYMADDCNVVVIAQKPFIALLWKLEYKARVFMRGMAGDLRHVTQMDVILHHHHPAIVTRADLAKYDSLNVPPYSGKHWISVKRKIRAAIMIGSQVAIESDDDGAISMQLVVNWPLPSGETQRLYPIFPPPNLPKVGKRVKRVNGVNAHLI